MSVSPTILLITLAVGVPLMLLALGVLYHAYLFSRQPLDLLEERVDTLATESAEDLLVALQMAVDDMQDQLSHQRDTLAGMLSDGRPVFATAAAAAERPMAAGEYVPQVPDAHAALTHESSMYTPAYDAGPQDLRGRVARLAGEGLSDRAIARELHVGLEEVRIARLRGRG
ncbi:MAG: hypothetical protein WD058_04010 [Dehalococcoidia bacterium]